MKKNNTSGTILNQKSPNIFFPRIKNIARIFLFTGVFCFISLMVFAQNVKVTINKQNVRLEVVMNEIESQSNYLFIYGKEINTNLPVTIKVKQQPLSQVLNSIFKDKNISYRLEGNHIILSRKKTEPTEKTTISITASSRIRITGNVAEVSGQPIVGANIVEAGTANRTFTNANGDFTLYVANNATINISSIGFLEQRIPIEGKNKFTVVLQENTNALDEFVVTGYQIMNKKDVVGSLTTVKMQDIYMPNYPTIDKMLQGMVPGMIVTNSSSRAGSSPSIQIRGASTLLGDSSPLWVVDGIIQEDPIKINVTTAMTTNLKEIIGNQVSWLNPMDIESITVLKDASATAIYGSKASNGVIVVTTKKITGQGRVRVNYNGSLTVNTRPNYGMFNLMNSQERIQFSDEVFGSGVPYSSLPYLDYNTYEGTKRLFIEGYITEEEFKRKRTLFETTNTDWFDLLTRTGYTQNNSLSLTGGTEKLALSASLAYTKQQGQEIGNDANRYSGRIAGNFIFNPKMRLNLAITGAFNKNSNFGTGVNPIGFATNTSRSIPAYDESGNLAYYQKISDYGYNKIQQSLSYNILNERDNSGSVTENTHLAITGDFKWDLTPWLSYNFTGGYNNVSNFMSSYMSEQTNYIANTYRGYDYGAALPDSEYFKAAILPFGGEYLTNEASQRSYNIQNKLNLGWNFENKSRLNILVAQELRSGTNISTGNTLWGFSKERGETLIRPTLPSDLVPTAGATFTYTGYGILDQLYNGRWARSNQTNNFMSLFATASYSFADRYVLYSSLRNDASNRFGQDVNKRFDPTYSIGASWRVSEENFVKKIAPQLTQFNLRVTYGIQGNALTNQSPDLLLFKGSKRAVFNQYYSEISKIPNPNLSWERTTNWNFGADIVLFKKYSATIDYYQRKSNAVLTQDIPYEFGIATTKMNGGFIYNRGIEGTFAFSPLNTKNTGFSISVNASRNWNTTGPVASAPNLSQYLSGRSEAVMKEGYPLSAFWSYSFAGLDPSNGNAQFNLFDTDQTLAKKDNTSFLVYSGESTPSVTGGMNLNFRYKSFSLGSSFTMIVGSKTRLPSPYANFTSGYKLPTATMNVSRDLLNRWKQPGDELITDIPSINPYNITLVSAPNGSSGTLIQFWESSDVRVVNASFLRCRDINLSWRLNQNTLRYLRVSNLSVTGSMNNLFVIGSDRFNGMDPELKNSVMPKSFSLGLACSL